MASSANNFRFFFLSFVLFICGAAYSQFYNLPVEYSSSLITEKKLAVKDSSIHSGVKPYIHFFSDKYVNTPDTHRIFKYIVDDPALDIAFFKHVISIEPHGQNFKLYIDPVFNVDMGDDHSNGVQSNVNTNGRGIIGAGYIGKNFYFESMFVENQALYAKYISDFAKATLVVPGQGRWKTFKTNGYDFAFSSGFISYQPVKNINIQLGHGKQKIGHGYRSLLLSDNAFIYPYARITQQWLKGKLQYTNIYAVMMNLVPATKIPVPNAERLFQKKAAAFQYLSINPLRFLNLGLFQGMIWEAGDAKNRQHLQWQYFNPIIYTNLIDYGLNNTNNIVAGADIKVKITRTLNIYGQLMADDLTDSVDTGKGFGYQAGIAYYDAFKLKHLTFQAEYNFVNEGSYRSPVTSTDQSFSHYNQSLAFTPGYGTEIFSMVDYKFKRFNLNLKFHHQTVPKDGDYYYTTRIANVKAGYLLNPAYNLNLAVGYIHRNQNFPNFKTLSLETNYIYLSLRTNLYNIYYDF